MLSSLLLRRNFSVVRRATGALPVRGLEEFFDPNRKPHEEAVFGRAWTFDELKRKSFDDLHKLWYVLLKERNVLLSEKWSCRATRIKMPGWERNHFVRKSMARIKHVLRLRQIEEGKAEEARKAAEEARKAKKAAKEAAKEAARKEATA